MNSWVIIGAVTFVVTFGSLYFTPNNAKWFLQLSRPKWLVFEPAIPVIWIMIIGSFVASANIVWLSKPGSVGTWILMLLYLTIEILTAAYIPATVKMKNFRVGAKIGLICVMTGLILLLSILRVSRLAALLLVPYLIWNPIGTEYTEDLIELK